ncbi:histone deacetylase family protein [Aquicoccus sp.]|uniref:histone deacetylase family protein n=1 Tax=Aquicoccus sp. TaxID=2055851 RepID=UPI00356B5A1E
MKTVFSETHALRDAKTELYGGELVYPFERPSRMTYIHDRLRAVDPGPILPPDDHGLDPVLRIHDTGFVDFLQTAWAEWQAEGYTGEAIATCWPARRMVLRRPDHIDGKLGYYALATETSLTEGTWPAAYGSAQVALTAAELIRAGERSAFALCRPPGHHAAVDMYGGYCFLNNAAIAAQRFLDNGAARVAILDVDFHHGNGTQDIFYDRSDVLFLSLHGEPENAFPHFLGYADETGNGAGEGFNVNYPMPPGTPFSEWRKSLDAALDRIAQYAPDHLIVSLGVDTFETDPISFFKLESPDFTTYGGDIARLKLPTLFVMEGGYDIDEIGINTVNVIEGFLGAA